MKTMECTPRETLKRYLAGWIDGEEGSQIEEHLAACEACEQTVVELQDNPDTLVDALRRQAALPENGAMRDAELGVAVSQVKRLMDSASHVGLPPMQPIPNQIGMYEIVEPLGRGGMATVYLARHRSLGKLVALKLRPAVWRESHEAAARFEREIRASGKLNHPAIVNATDAGEQHGIQYLVMEYISGMDLGRIARHLKSLKIADACEMMRQVALGLSHAHAEGIVHRDVKPSNLMLDEKGSVKILDFGLAQVDLWDEATAELTSVGQLMGTLDYMAPEQAERSGAVDYRADLYSLGATLFRLLCGRAPLAAAPNLSPLDKLRLLAQHQPPRLETLRDDAPRELTDLVAALLSREPDNRPPSAAHVAEQLTSLAIGADLPALLSEAKEREAARGTSGEDNSRTGWTAMSLAQAQPRTASGRGGRVRSWLAIAALAPLAILAAVIVVLETQKGNFVIESQVPGVSVKLLQEGETVESMRVEVGTTSTRLAAGKYEVLIDSPSDAVVLDKQDFVVKRGATTIARITQKPASPTGAAEATFNAADPTAPPDPPNYSMPGAPASGQLVYEGRTLDQWLDQLSTDRSPKAIGDSLAALEAMLVPENATRISETVLNVLPNLNGRWRVGSSREIRTIDDWGFDILLKSMDIKSFFEMIGREVGRGDAKWAERVLTRTVQMPLVYSYEDVKPVLEQIDQKIFRNAKLDGPEASLIRIASQWLWGILFDQHTGDELRDHVFRIVNSSPQFRRDFWLSKPPIENWPSELEKVVVGNAAIALTDPESKALDVTRACMILFAHLRLRDSSSVLDVDELARAIQSRIARLSKDESRVFEVLDLGEPGAFREFVAPVYAAVSSVDSESYWRNPKITGLTSDSVLQFYSDGEQTAETQELLDLALLVRSKYSRKFDASELMALTSSAYMEIRRAIPKGDLQLSWPSFKPTGGEFSARRQAAELLPAQWLAYLFHIQAAEVSGTPVPVFEPEPEVQSPGNPSALTEPSIEPMNPPAITVTPTPSELTAEEAVYEGRTLEDWLRQLARDRSPKTIGDSLTAIEAMQTPENSASIRETLFGILPKIAGGTVVPLRTGQQVSIDYKAFRIVASAMPTREYFQRLATELTVADEGWAKRILVDGGFRRVGATDEDIEPLADWLRKQIFESDQLDDGGRVLVEPAWNWMLWALTREQASEEFIDRAVESLENSSHLGLEFWLRQPPESTWPSKIRKLIISKAEQTLQTIPVPESKLVTQACMILSLELKQPTRPINIDLEGLASAVQRHLNRLGNDPDRAFATVELGHKHFGKLVTPAFIFGHLPGGNGLYQFSFGSAASELQELLDVAHLIQEKNPLNFDVRKLGELTQPDYLEVRKQIPMGAFLEFNWPDFRNIQNQLRGGLRRFDTSTDPSTKQWLSYLFYIQAAALAGTPVPLSEPAQP